MALESSWIVFIDLILLLATVMLVLMVWWKAPESEPVEPPVMSSEPTHLREWDALKQEMMVITERCKDIARKIPRPVEVPPAARPVETALAIQLRSLSEVFQKWQGAVRRSMGYATVYESDLRKAEDQLSACLHDALIAGTFLSQRREEEIRKTVLDMVKMAVQLVDRDLDRDKSDGGLQQKLGELARCARYELYSPKRGEDYRRPGADRKIKVERVLARGLRDTSGKVVMSPEVEEMR